MTKSVFAKNLKQAIKEKGLTFKEAAERAGLEPKTLYRWVQEGITKTDSRTEGEFNELCKLLEVERNDLWKDQATCDVCAAKVREMVRIWEHVGVGFQWIDRRYIAARVVDRLRRDCGELWAMLKRTKNIGSDAGLHKTLEDMVCEWLNGELMSEGEAYERLKMWAVKE